MLVVIFDLLYFAKNAEKSKKTTKSVVNDYKNSKLCVIIITSTLCGGVYMTPLKSNINRYMELKGIKNYSCLLIDIAHTLGIKGEEAYKFAKNEKSNFSKMLKGERPLKHDFIIPLEKIFGVSLARLLDENAYKLPVEKDNIPYNKGFRYYAYLDDPKLYKEEFDLLLAKDGKTIISKTDEFGKTFLDYVVEYRAVNGVRYLRDEYGIKLKWYYNNFDFNERNGVTWLSFDNAIEFARLVAGMEDADLFYDIYDSYHMFYSNGHYGGDDSIFCNDEYLAIILDNKHLFKSLFETKQYQYKLGSIGRKKRNAEYITYHSINPIINNCLRYALEHLEIYKNQAIEILKFAIHYNEQIVRENTDGHYICNELGSIKRLGDREYYKLVIFVDVNVDDPEIKELVSRIHVFGKQ